MKTTVRKNDGPFLPPPPSTDIGDGGLYNYKTGDCVSHPSLCDELIVFQAAPLVWRGEDGELHPIEKLDFERERDILAESLSDAAMVGGEINLVHDIATVNNLAAFLATSETRVLYFSCHGVKGHLCFEDGSGGVQFVGSDELKDLISTCKGKLHFVHISACFSQAAGEAFVKAGVPHVLCTQQEEQTMDLAAIEFARTFYRALACGKTLRASFELGRQAVRLSPLVQDADNEMSKFMLLPENGVNHDVPVFFTDKKRQSTHGPRKPRIMPSSSWILPCPPHIFIGREMEIYQVLKALEWARLVRVSGPRGIGKRSLVAATCHYIRYRSRIFGITDIIWLPLLHTSRNDQLSSCLHLLVDMIRNESDRDSLDRDSNYSLACGTLIEALAKQKSTLIVIDTNNFSQAKAGEMRRLSAFLQDLFQATSNVKAILVDHGPSVVLTNSCTVEAEIKLEPLSFKDTASLFGKICPFVLERRCSSAITPRQLSDLLVPYCGEGSSEAGICGLSETSAHIFTIIGKGIPAAIHTAAKEMKPEEYDRLVEIGKRNLYIVECRSRDRVRIQLKRAKQKLQAAVRICNFDLANEIQHEIDEFKGLCDTLPDLTELQNRIKALKKDSELAEIMRDSSRAEILREQLVFLEERVQQDKSEVLKFRITESWRDSSSEQDETDGFSLKFRTRAELEAEIRKVENLMREAALKGNFNRARDLQKSCYELEAYRKLLPSSEELSSKLEAMKNDLDVANDVKDFIQAGVLCKKIQILEERLRLENFVIDSSKQDVNVCSAKQPEQGYDSSQSYASQNALHQIVPTTTSLSPSNQFSRVVPSKSYAVCPLVFGAIVGDIAASTYENHNCKSERCNIFARGSRCASGSVLTIATANHFVTGNSYEEVYRKFTLKYPDAGYGVAFFEWANSSRSTPYNSWGSGSAKRVSPIGWVADDLEWALEEAEQSAKVTHDHPAAIKGAQAVAGAVFLARQKKDKYSIRSYIEKKFGYNLHRTVEDIRPKYSWDPSCEGSVPEAIIAFLDSSSFEDAIRKAISLGGVSTTIASIAGAIAHAFYGSIPGWMVSYCLAAMDDEQLASLEGFWKAYSEGFLRQALSSCIRERGPPVAKEKVERAPQAMFGAIVGNVAGSTYKYNNCKSEKCRIFAGGSRCTDDSILTIATANHFLSGDSYEDVYRKFTLKYPDAGYGKWFYEWASSGAAPPFSSWGNGSAMRVSPIGWVADNLEWALEEAEHSAKVTHTHPSAIKGAQAVVAAVYLSRQGKDKEFIRSYIEENFRYNLHRTVEAIRPTYSWDVSCERSVPEAIIAFLDSSSFEDAIRKAISLGGVSDTIASIAGAIAHAFYGSIPRWMVSYCYAVMDDEQCSIVNNFWRTYIA